MIFARFAVTLALCAATSTAFMYVDLVLVFIGMFCVHLGRNAHLTILPLIIAYLNISARRRMLDIVFRLLRPPRE
jgi:hypothetical protein